VRLVIRRVEVDTIPASREERLGPETVWAVEIGESWGLWCRRLIDADCGPESAVTIVRERDLPFPSDGLSFWAAWCASTIWVSYDHAKAVWKGLHGFIATGALEVVPASLIRRNSLLKLLRNLHEHPSMGNFLE
jgi:hypothetical protein